MFRIEIDARETDQTEYRPHGIKYRLVLLDPNGTRIIGYDNAHRHKIKPKRQKYDARKITWDHKHKVEEVTIYEFKSASQLLNDFFNDVQKITKFY